MGNKTGISWCDYTFNPWIGCQAVSAACDHCYARTMVQDRWGQDFAIRRRTTASWDNVRRWDRKARADGIRRRVFVASLADVFDNQVPAEWRADLWRLILECRGLDFMLLTKRPQNIRKMLPADWGELGYSNVWLGATVETQEQAAIRLPHLLSVRARLHFVSAEPLLDWLRLDSIATRYSGMSLNALTGEYSPPAGAGIKSFAEALASLPGGQPMGCRIGFVIVGGESGAGARPMHPDWARVVRDDCRKTRTPFHFKQWGQWGPFQDTARKKDAWAVGTNGGMRLMADIAYPDGKRRQEAVAAGAERTNLTVMYDRGARFSGRELDGAIHDALPTPPADPRDDMDCRPPGKTPTGTRYLKLDL